MLATLTVALLSAASVSANLIKNGDFENHSAAFCKQSWCLVPDAAIAPWKVTKGTQVEVDNQPWPAFSGAWSIDLSGNSAYGIAQTVQVTPGRAYMASFMLKGNPFCADKVKTGTIQASGQYAMPFSHDVSVGGNNWKLVTYPFVATQAATTLTIESTTASSCGPVIDNVALVQMY